MATVLERQPASPPTIARPAATKLGNRAPRIHYLDNLRALAMLLGVLLHGAFAYAKPAQTFWLATDPDSSVAIDAAIWFVHLFRMALFFFVAGYFSKLVLERSGAKRMLVRRTVRLVVPFLLFYPCLLVAMTLLFAFGLSYVESPRGLMGLIAEAAKQNPGSQRGELPGTMHLWFLYYLIFFTLIGVAASRLPRPRLPALLRRPAVLPLAPLILIPGVVGAGVPIPGPESFIPAWWPFAFYGPFFFAGWQWYGREQTLDRLRPYAWHLVIGSLLLFVPYYLSMPVLDLPSLLQAPELRPLWLQALACLLTAYLSATLTVASLLLGQKFLAKSSMGLKLLSDSAYWVYLIHLPIVLFLQTLFLPFSWSLWIKLLLTLVGTFAFCLATYIVFVRYTPLGWLLHGKRSFP